LAPDGSGDWGPEESSSTEAPRITAVDVPDWPPLGPGGAIVVHMTDNEGLSRLESRFAQTRSVALTGTSASESLSSHHLGEGYGTLTLWAFDSRGAFSTREVSNLLVDLTPPEIVLMNETVRQGTEGINTDVELWVADNWVLGSVRLEVGDTVLERGFPAGFPATFATTWDASLVKFNSASLPAGRRWARIVATDAAGNSAQESFELLVDATPPRVEILWPLPGASVGGLFEVRVDGSDEEGDVQIELWAGGSPLTTVLGPTATVQLDATELVGGPLPIEAIAVDGAGNRSEPARCIVIVK
jgi:hypothetical protein